MSLLSQQLSDLAVDFPQEADKWSAFFNRLSVDEDLPPLPGGQQCEGESLSGGPECHFRILRSSAGRDQSAQIRRLRPFRRRIFDGEQRGRAPSPPSGARSPPSPRPTGSNWKPASNPIMCAIFPAAAP